MHEYVMRGLHHSYAIQRLSGFHDGMDSVDGLLRMNLDSKVVEYSHNGVNYRL